MLEKYQHFTKTARHHNCCFYSAIDKNNNKAVSLKRVHSPLAWDDLLMHPHLHLARKPATRKLFPKIVEIFKHKGHFFIVQESPGCSSLSHTSPVTRLPMD